MTLTIIKKIIKQELGGLFHDRIGAPCEELAIASEIVMIPQVQAQPGPTHRPNACVNSVDGHGVSPQICVVMDDKPARAIKSPGDSAPVLSRVIDQVEKRLVQL